MKKIIGLISAVVLLLSILTGCGKEPQMPNSFVEDGEERFILVDQWKEVVSSDGVRRNFTAIADKETDVMYLILWTGYGVGITPLLCEDGSPMLYDPF